MSAILKDADALDRERFGTRGRLKPEYLRTESASSTRMIAYAQKINGVYAKEMLDRNYAEIEKQSEFTSVRTLQAVRNKNRYKEESTLSVDEMLDLFDNVQNEYSRPLSISDKKKTVLKSFGESTVSEEDIVKAEKMLGADERVSSLETQK